MTLSMMVVRLKFYFAWTVGKICGLLTKREVKMAGYWPSFFLCFSWAENEANFQPS